MSDSDGQSSDEQSEEVLTEQDVPNAEYCPYCGAEATVESQARHSLSDLDYLHDDVSYDCSECGEGWTHGVPIGEYSGELADEKWCDACDDSYALVHRVDTSPLPDELILHFKCPNCYKFTSRRRTVTDRKIVLVGDPRITGETEGSQEWASRE